MLSQLSFSVDVWQERERVVPRWKRPLDLEYHLVQTEPQLEQMVATLSASRDISHDTEGTGLVPALGARIIGHSFGTQTRPPTPEQPAQISLWYVPIRHVLTPEPQLPVELVSSAVCSALTSPGRCAWAHAKHDWAQLLADGIVPTRERHDVLTLANLFDENEHNFKLKHLADKHVLEGAADEEKVLEDFMRADARALGLKYKQRKKAGLDDVEEVGEPTYLERFGYSRTPVHMCGKYACRDALYTLCLWLVTYHGIAAQFSATYAREMALAEVLCEMEYEGLPVSEERIRDAIRRTALEMEHWLGEVRRLVGDRDFGATEDELRAHLHERLALPVAKWTGGGKGARRRASVDREARELLKAAHPEHAPLLDAVSKLAVAQKIHGTYGLGFLRFYSPATGRIYPSYNAAGRKERGVPVTGRLSSEKPNVQNVVGRKKLVIGEWPGGEVHELKIQRYFIVPDGFVRLYVDFSQIELRVLAWFCQDPNLLSAYPVVGEDRDVHQIMADLLGILRTVAKEANFLIIYGGTEVALAQRMLPAYYQDPEGTREEARAVIADFHHKTPLVHRFRDRFAAEARRSGCMFVNPFGRPRRIPDLAAMEHWIRESALRRMMSSIVSGTAADLMKECMLRTHPWLRRHSPPSRLKQSIHDELVFDLELSQWQSLTLGIKAMMEDWPMFTAAGPQGRGQGVGIKVSCAVAGPGQSWADKQKLKFDGGGRILNADVIG